MFDPALIDAITKLGATGLAIAAVLAFLRGDIRVGKLVDADFKRVLAERDTWMQRALASDKRVDRLADAVETALSIKVPD